MSTVTVESNPQLHKRLLAIWKSDKIRRDNVVGPDGINYKVYTPNDDVIVFAPQTGMDGTYGQRSTKGLAG